MSEKVEAVPESGFESPATGLAAQVAHLEEALETLGALLAKLNARTEQGLDDLRDEARDKVGRDELAAIRKELERLGSRVDDVVDEVGYGETLDPAKVPPAILEHAYQAILDDIVAELKKTLGAHDSERHIGGSLEQLRLKTSGSELFHFRPQDHRVEVSLRKPLEKGLVSARQVQMTFEELRRHLLEPIHTHAPKNFRALVKLKSQEFAVDRALHLARDVERLGDQTRALQIRLDRLETHVAGALKDVQDFAENLRATLANVATRESVEALEMRLSAMQGALAPQATREVAPQEASPDEALIALLADGPRTVAELRRDLGIADNILREALARLEARNRIAPTVRGRTTTYRLKEDSDNA